MKTKVFYSLTALALALAHSQAAIVISDGFSGGDGASIIGRAPDGVNTAGNTYVKSGSGSGFHTTTTAGYGNPLPGAFGEPQSAGAVELNTAGGGGYISPSNATITLTLDLRPLGVGTVGITGAAANGRGVALGFFAGVTGNQFSQNQFTGFVFDTAGALNFVSDPNASGFFGAGSTVGTAVAYGGFYNNTAFNTLSYTINRATGAVTAISLSGSSADYSSFLGTTAFTEAATRYAGFYSSGETGGGLGAIDNFSVDVIPEPSAALLSGLGVLALLRRRRN